MVLAPRRKEDVKQSNVTKKMRLWVAAVRLNVTNAELLRRSSESICSSHLPQLVSRVEYTFLYPADVHHSCDGLDMKPHALLTQCEICG